MKFSHKVVAASSALLLVTVSLLSIQQLYTVRSAVENHVNASLKEMVSGVKNTVESEMNAKKALFNRRLKSSRSTLKIVHT